MQLAIHHTERPIAHLTIAKAPIFKDCRPFPIKASEIGEIESVLDQIGRALAFIPFKACLL